MGDPSDGADLVPGGGSDQLRLRPGPQRFHTRLDWLDSRHSFSFGSHRDPLWDGFGALRVINEDIVQPGSGFGMHPHRDMEIVTVMLQGKLQHRDSLGHGASLRAGELQRMTAGSGILHSEWNHGSDPCRLLQIWIEPSRAGLTPSYEQRPVEAGRDWTLLLDPGGVDNSMAIAQEVRLWRAGPQGGDRLDLPLAADRLAWLQLIAGRLRLSCPQQPELVLAAGDGLGFRSGDVDALQVDQSCDLLLFELP